MSKRAMLAVTVGSVGFLLVSAPVWGVGPSLTNMSVTGNLIAGQDCTVSVSCTVAPSETGRNIESVVFDLSAIGWTSIDVTQSGYQWTGQVTPPVEGIRAVYFTATETWEEGTPPVTKTATTTSAILVGVKSSDLTITGTFAQGQSISLSCTPTGTDVESVTVDLSRLGISSPVELADGDEDGVWLGSATMLVAPPASGLLTIPYYVVRSGAPSDKPASTTVVEVPGSLRVLVPGVDDSNGNDTWIPANRVVQGESCQMTIECSKGTGGGNPSPASPVSARRAAVGTERTRGTGGHGRGG